MQEECKKIAFIVQRYGAEVNGGAEQHCRLLAEHLSAHYEVDVLTSCALTYLTWDNHYPATPTTINGVNVIRFPTVISRKVNRQNYRFIRRRRIWQKILKRTPVLDWLEKKSPSLKPSKADFDKWVHEQGPAVPELITYLRDNQGEYKALIFFTYLYYPTINGLEIAPSKSILIPTAHDENPIYIPFFRRIFHLPKVIIYNTIHEKKFVNQLFNNEHICSEIAGVGIDFPVDVPFIDVKKEYKIAKDYILYVGRIEAGKGCTKLIDYFRKYHAQNNSVQLVLIGQLFMDIPAHPDIIHLGYVSEEVKFNALSQAKILVMPSLYESLSMVTLEAMKLAKPVVVNGKCEVLKNHVEQSQGGFYYENYSQFEESINTLLTNMGLNYTMGLAGKKYVEENYGWDKIISTLTSTIENIEE